MDYLGFELHIGAGDGTNYPVSVIHAAAGGEPRMTAVLPVNDEALRLAEIAVEKGYVTPPAEQQP